jgi:uncharacterized 2Fe-2S/4Fe-4S cluster protein (DUF4445 family)
MSKPSQADYQERRDRLTGILSDIVDQADRQSLVRCPYKNKSDECTAAFACQNQRKSKTNGSKVLLCAADDKLDYRSAWESDPNAVIEAKNRLGNERQSAGQTSSPDNFGKTLFDLADELARQVPTSCGRGGICHECIVEVTQGETALSAKTEAESFLLGNYRLACQAVIEQANTDVEFSLLRREPKILTGGYENPVELDAMVCRKGDQVLYDGKKIDRYRGHLYGLAIDLGTTTIVMDLIDLESGETIQLSSFENPQRFGGSDIMNRISYDGQHKDELWKAVVNTINFEIESMAATLQFSTSEIYEIVVVGNSTMRDILFRLDVQGIGQKPYKSITEHELIKGERETTSLNASSRRLGIKINRSARVYSPPLVASHVGADITAGLGLMDFANTDETVMLVDVGTNTEVVISHAGRMLTASCPAGPAFEGGLIKFGMPGYDGAIDSIRISGEGYDYTTIGEKAPQGLCGSGLIDLLAELRRHDRMTKKGVFADKRQFEFKLFPDHHITFSREDASNLAQAKAANYCGQLILMRHMGLAPSDIDKLYLAGGFANFVDVQNAIEIGFLPPVPEDRIEKIGNSAARGAREILLSRKKREAAEELVKDIEHIELETTPDFFELFVDGCQFKPMPA